jgi:hypothetical protein
MDLKQSGFMLVSRIWNRVEVTRLKVEDDDINFIFYTIHIYIYNKMQVILDFVQVL